MGVGGPILYIIKILFTIVYIYIGVSDPLGQNLKIIPKIILSAKYYLQYCRGVLSGVMPVSKRKSNGSGKVTMSVTVDEPVKRRLDKMSDINKSGLVNQFLEDFVSAGNMARSGLQYRKRRLENKEEQLENELEAVREELAAVEEKLEERDERSDEIVENAVEKVLKMRTPIEEISPDNPGVVTQAQNANMDPNELLEAAKERAQ